VNYFKPYVLPLDEAMVAAWDSQVAAAVDAPSLAETLAAQSVDLFPRFADAYAQLCNLPRGARRALQRRLARSWQPAVPIEWQRKLAGSVAGAALLLALGQGTAEAVDIVVNTTNPAVIPDGKCSLIEAIENANSGSTVTHPDCPNAVAGANTIQLPANKTITLTTAQGYYYYSDTGLPLISSQITIAGNGTKIARKSTAPQFRILAVGYPNGNLTLNKVIISGGSTTASGGGIYNNNISTLTNKSVVTGNKADAAGGGIFNYGSLTITNSTISKNTAYDGGGLYSYSTAGFYSSFSISNSTISGNTAIYGAGIFNGAGGQGAVNNSSTISANKAKLIYDTYSYSFVGGVGGGVFNAGSLDIANSTITNNSGYYGGGAFNDANGELTLDASTVSGNTAKIKTIITHYSSYTYRYFYGGIGGGIDNAGSLSVTNSAISGNIAKGKVVRKRDGYGGFYTYRYGGDGGGIYNSGAADLTGGSITNNTATNHGGGINNGGYYGYGSYTNSGTTITNNTAKYGPDVYP